MDQFRHDGSAAATPRDYLPDQKGLEIYGLDRTVRNSLDSLFLLDSNGKTIWKETGTTEEAEPLSSHPQLGWHNQPMVLAFNEVAPSMEWPARHGAQMPMDGNAMVVILAATAKPKSSCTARHATLRHCPV